MSVIARFEVIPVREGSMSSAIASALRALDRHPVTYRTTPTDTIIEAETVDQVFAAVRDAHRAIPTDRVVTSIEVDEDRRRQQQHMDQRVASVERELGHPARREQAPTGQQTQGRSGQQSPGRSGQYMRHREARSEPGTEQAPTERGIEVPGGTARPIR